MSRVKQVIVLRTDLKNSQGQKIRTGKLVAQGAHASMKVILDLCLLKEHTLYLFLDDKEPIEDWLNGLFTKVCVGVDSESKLIELYNSAKSAGIPCSLIEDAGLTEFNGVKTKTAVAIGPWNADEIDVITGELKLL